METGIEMQLADLKQPVFIAPANPTGRSLMAHFKQKNISVLGLIDNLKQGEDIYSPGILSSSSALVVVAFGSFQKVVTTGLLENGVSPKVILLEQADHSLRPYRPTLIDLKRLGRNFYIKLLQLAQVIPWRSKRVYYAESFVDANVLLTYVADLERGAAAMLVVDTDAAAPLDLPYISMSSSPFKALYYLIFARSYVIDHEYQSLTFTTLRQQVPVVQLWHGLPYKQISGNIHYTGIRDACFISSSSWFNEFVFKERFNSDSYLSLGYPRNDAFFQTRAERCFINSQPLVKLEQVIAKTGGLIIYAPTFRDNQHNTYPLDLVLLEEWCQKHQRSFIIKYHPFIYRAMVDNIGISATAELQLYPGFSHIYIFPNGQNIYPWLADAQILITDYSSLAFDFMLTSKPIIYYQYDKEEYELIRGQPIVGDESFVQGDIAIDFEHLLKTLTMNLTYSLKKYPAMSQFNSQQTVCCLDILRAIDHIEVTRA